MNVLRFFKPCHCCHLIMSAALVAGWTAAADVVVENARFKLVLADNARAKSLVVKATGKGTLEWTLGPKKTLSNLEYVATDLSRGAVKAEWAKARLAD